MDNLSHMPSPGLRSSINGLGTAVFRRLKHRIQVGVSMVQARLSMYSTEPRGSSSENSASHSQINADYKNHFAESTEWAAGSELRPVPKRRFFRSGTPHLSRPYWQLRLPIGWARNLLLGKPLQRHQASNRTDRSAWSKSSWFQFCS